VTGLKARIGGSEEVPASANHAKICPADERSKRCFTQPGLTPNSLSRMILAMSRRPYRSRRQIASTSPRSTWRDHNMSTWESWNRHPTEHLRIAPRSPVVVDGTPEGNLPNELSWRDDEVQPDARAACPRLVSLPMLQRKVRSVYVHLFDPDCVAEHELRYVWPPGAVSGGEGGTVGDEWPLGGANGSSTLP
jgi:hypothetical protein